MSLASGKTFSLCNSRWKAKHNGGGVGGCGSIGLNVVWELQLTSVVFVFKTRSVVVVVVSGFFFFLHF